MIAANGVTARFLSGQGLPSLRRVVRSPERWQRIVEVARENGERLPPEPDSKALSDFRPAAKGGPGPVPGPLLVIVKLMGAGDTSSSAQPAERGPLRLAVRDYAHSTAPNRRYPDLITQRLLKAALAGAAAPYPEDELEELARHCTEQEDNADKVERQVRKSAAAMLLQNRIDHYFDAIVTGASEKGTWVDLRPAGGGQAGPRVRGSESRPEAPRQAHHDGRRTRFHRLRPRLTSERPEECNPDGPST